MTAARGAITFGNLGYSYWSNGSDRARHRATSRSLWPSIARSVTDSTRGHPRATWAAATVDLGQTARANDYLEQSLAIAREVGDRRGEGYALFGLSRLSIDEGRPEDAIRQAIEAVRIGEETGDP